MKLNETTLSFLEVDCIQQFGKEKGNLIFEQVEKIFQELLNNADYRNNAAIQNHLQAKLFPTLAYYKTLRENGINQDEALEYVRKETHKAANIKREEMKKLGNMPFAYTIYRLGVKKHMRKNFPDTGWTTEWVKCNGKEIHFNLHKCIYWELTKMYHCPELFCVICENDDMSMGALQAAEAEGKDLVIIGVDGISDALQAVKDGRLSASVLQDADGQASAVIDVAVKVGVGEEVESRYNVPFQLITADNVDDYLE